VVAIVLLGYSFEGSRWFPSITGALGWLLGSCWVVLVGCQGVARNLLGIVCGWSSGWLFDVAL